MTVAELRAALADKPDDWIVDARIDTGALGDFPVTDVTELADTKENGLGWVTLILDEWPS